MTKPIRVAPKHKHLDTISGDGDIMLDVRIPRSMAFHYKDAEQLSEHVQEALTEAIEGDMNEDV